MTSLLRLCLAAGFVALCSSLGPAENTVTRIIRSLSDPSISVPAFQSRVKRQGCPCCANKCPKYVPWVKIPRIDPNRGCGPTSCKFNMDGEDVAICNYSNQYGGKMYASIEDAAVNPDGDIPFESTGENPENLQDGEFEVLQHADHMHAIGVEISEEEKAAFLKFLQAIDGKKLEDVEESSYRNWVTAKGQFGNWVTGIRQACEDCDPDAATPEENIYAAAYVLPKQLAIMSVKIDAKKPVLVTFYGYANTEDINLEICCDSECSNKNFFDPANLVTSKWQPLEHACKKGTQFLSFQCHNEGENQGSCGVDEITCVEV